MKRAIITGPTGAIGIALIQELVSQGMDVVAVCRPNSKRICNLPKHANVTVIECDLNNLKKLSMMNIPVCDVFYHFGWDGTVGAARNNMYGQLQNIQYTLDAVEVAEKLGCKVFVGAGSQAEYGRVEGKLTAKTPAFPENGYGIAKLCAGNMSRIACEQKGIKHIWTRILSVYGPYDGENSMIMSVIGKLLNEDVPELTKGEQKWDYLYSRDAAYAMYLVGENGIHGKTYCIGSGEAKPLAEYVQILRDAIDSELELGFGKIPYAEKQVMYLCADIKELSEDTGFVPRYTFEEGIKETINWCRNR